MEQDHMNDTRGWFNFKLSLKINVSNFDSTNNANYQDTQQI